jgi:DNA-binding response OmpR family regulator
VSTRLLVVEDDEPIARPLCESLRAHGYEVTWVASGVDALAEAAEPVDLVLLDLGLPDLDGLEVCRRLRDQQPQTEIIILTARRDEVDIVLGLDAGADDYLVKPFRLHELLARVRARLRRQPGGADVVTVGDLQVDFAARRVHVGELEVERRPKEFDLLALLVRETGRVVTRERIMSEVWDEHWFGSTKTLDVHVSWLRRKLGDGPGRGGLITTVRGVGLRFET